MNPNTPESGTLNLDENPPFVRRTPAGGTGKLFPTPKQSPESDFIRASWRANREAMAQKYGRFAPPQPKKEGSS